VTILCAPTRGLSFAFGRSHAIDPLVGVSHSTPPRGWWRGDRGYESRVFARGLAEAVTHRPRAFETRALRWGICGGHPLDSNDTTPRPRPAGVGRDFQRSAPQRDVTCGAPSGGCQVWSPTTHVTPPPGGVREGASPDQAPLRGLTQTKGAQAPSIWAPWRGREACGSFPIRGGTRSRDQISANEHIPQGLPSEDWKFLGLSSLGFRGTYKSWLTQNSMGQISLPVEECSLIRVPGATRGPCSRTVARWAPVPP